MRRYWDEKRKQSRDPATDFLVVKNSEGVRQFHPDAIKETTACYYENLFKKKPVTFHPYHQELELKIIQYLNDDQYDELDYNQIPTKEEIKEIIERKKNNKSTPDV